VRDGRRFGQALLGSSSRDYAPYMVLDEVLTFFKGRMINLPQLSCGSWEGKSTQKRRGQRQGKKPRRLDRVRDQPVWSEEANILLLERSRLRPIMSRASAMPTNWTRPTVAVRWNLLLGAQRLAHFPNLDPYLCTRRRTGQESPLFWVLLPRENEVHHTARNSATLSWERCYRV
jgi:hypothetical protein